MKKVIIIAAALFASVILLAHFCVFAGVDNGEVVIKLDSVSGLPGQSVDVNMTLEKNPGITGLRFKVAYDASKLELEKAVYTKIGGGGLTAVNIKNNPVVLLWNVSLYEFTDTGVLATLTFKIKEGAQIGDVPLKVTWGKGDCIDYDLKNLTIDMTNGNVHVDYDGTNCEHTNSTTKVTKEPTCTEGGVFEVSCNACSTVLSSGDLARKEHTYGTLIVTREPTYTEVGLMEQKCSACGDIRTEPIEMLDPPETEEPIVTQAPTTQAPTTQAPTTQKPTATQAPTTTKAPENPDTQAETDSAVMTDTITSPAAPIETAPATGDDTMVFVVISAVSLVMIALLLISKIRDRRKFK